MTVWQHCPTAGHMLTFGFLNAQRSCLTGPADKIFAVDAVMTGVSPVISAT